MHTKCVGSCPYFSGRLAALYTKIPFSGHIYTELGFAISGINDSVLIPLANILNCTYTNITAQGSQLVNVRLLQCTTSTFNHQCLRVILTMEWVFCGKKVGFLFIF